MKENHRDDSRIGQRRRSPSTSELVYDRLIANEKLKDGTKYERLAALVFKVMNANADVVHHVILRADDKEASHEIDVAVNIKGRDRTTLIECRDRNRPVAEGEVRDFFGKVHQLNPDVGMILSPAGFTSGAVKFAGDEGIVLGEFRPIKDTDSWIETVRIEAKLLIPTDPTITGVEWTDPDEVRRVGAALQDRRIRLDPYSDVLDDDGRRIGELRHVLTSAIAESQTPPDENGVIDTELRFPAPRTVEISGIPLRINAFRVHFLFNEVVETFEVKASGVAEMILQVVSGEEEGTGRVFTDKDFGTLTFDDAGRVVRRGDPSA